ncbi:MAG TPA: AtpZ/AtpI family protein [Gammaproteobacteria bacterium]
MLASTLGWNLAASVCVGGGLGYWGDRAWGTKPWLTITGLVLGIAAGFYQFIKASIGPRPDA